MNRFWIKEQLEKKFDTKLNSLIVYYLNNPNSLGVKGINNEFFDAISIFLYEVYQDTIKKNKKKIKS